MIGFTTRDRLILAGLYLSKFDAAGIEHLGFKTFTEAFNAIGLGLGSRPASVKNYRDEFDPLFPNPRQGWHKRKIRDYCRLLYERYSTLSLEEFTRFLKPLLLGLPALQGLEDEETETDDLNYDTAFARRLITGAAAENYFESIFPKLEPFAGYRLSNTTRIGCGFDFLVEPPETSNFLAVEVKGLRDSIGTIALTEKEHRVASRLSDRYFLCVVRNFAEKPFHTLYQNPIYSNLRLARVERTIVSVTWTVLISG